MLDLDAILDEAQLETGGVNDVVLAQAEHYGRSDTLRLAAVMQQARGGKMPDWTPEEDRFLRENIGHMSRADIAKYLGRTDTAVKVRQVRMGIPSPSKQPGDMTATQVAKLLGIDNHASVKLIKRGIMPGRRIPGEKGILVVKRTDLIRWLMQLESWVYVPHIERITNPALRRMVQRKAAMWGDEWWTTGQVAAYHGVMQQLVTKHVGKGWLPGVRWANRRVRKSVAMNHSFVTGKGSNGLNWSADGDAFMVLARAIGLSYAAIDRLMKLPRKRAGYRLGYLHERGLIPAYIESYGLRVQYDPADGRLFADWRDYRDRFPAVVRAIERFRRERIIKQDKTILGGILRAWADWYAGDDNRRQSLARALKYASNWTAGKLHRAYWEMLKWDICPL